MFIASVKRKGNNAEIVTDEGRKFTLDLRVVYDNGLRKNDEIDEEKFLELTEKSNFIKINDSVFRLLARRSHSFHELKTKLILKKYDKKIIDNVLAKIRSKNLIDDRKFAEEFFDEKFNKKKQGINRIRIALIKKGIEKSIIEEIISSADTHIAQENAKILALKKLNHLKAKEIDKRKISSKIYSFLNMRGFENEIIINVVKSLNLDNEDEN